MSSVNCPDCGGHRLKKEVLAVTVGDYNISEFCRMSVTQALDYIHGLSLSDRDRMIADQILKEICDRLGFLKSVGLEYLTLSRSAGTLSGGESQRIRLATQIGSSLVGVLYILDEPSIGLHQRDNDKLIATLKRLRDLGNTLIVVEHDEDTMVAADYVVDIGPGAGEHHVPLPQVADGCHNAALPVIPGVVVGGGEEIEAIGAHIVQAPGVRHGPGAAGPEPHHAGHPGRGPGGPGVCYVNLWRRISYALYHRRDSDLRRSGGHP